MTAKAPEGRQEMVLIVEDDPRLRRLLQRLLDQGLQAERDLPSFLRYAGLKERTRARPPSSASTPKPTEPTT